MQSEPQGARTLVWALPRSLAATYGIDVSFSSSGYLDVSVHRVPLHTLWIGVWMTEVSSAGFPHSDISGSMDICSSPKLFAAYHVFHRLLVPRHPPCALLRLTIHIYSVICAAGSIFMSFILVLLYLFSYGLSSVPILGCLVMNLFIDLQTIHRIFFFYMRFSRYVTGNGCIIDVPLPNGDGEIRTLDPLLARQVLSQLSYTPILVVFMFLA